MRDIMVEISFAAFVQLSFFSTFVSLKQFSLQNALEVLAYHDDYHATLEGNIFERVPQQQVDNPRMKLSSAEGDLAA